MSNTKNKIEILARRILTADTSYQWLEAPEEVREECLEAAKAVIAHIEREKAS